MHALSGLEASSACGHAAVLSSGVLVNLDGMQPLVDQDSRDGGRMTVVFLDTNVFMHYKPINEIDWVEILGDNQVEIVVPRVVLRELDRHKDSHNRGYLRERARKRLHQLELWGNMAEIREGVVLRLLPRLELPRESYDLDRDQPDDQLLLALLWYREQHASTSMLLISHDVGPRIAATALNIPARAPDESLRLPEHPDPVQKELQELQRENRRLKSAKPRLRLAHLHESVFKIHVSLLVTESPPSDLEAIDRQIEALRRRHPPHASVPSENSQQLHLGAASVIEGLLRVPERDIEAYNKRLDDFIEGYRRTLIAREEVRRSRALTHCLEFHLVNEGTQPGESVDIHMHFPDGFRLLSEADLPSLPDLPTPPAKPRTPIDKLSNPDITAGLPSIPNYRDMTTLVDFGIRGNVSDPEIERGNSYNVKLNVGRIKHNTSVPLPLLCLVFESFSVAKSFTIDYELHADNLPDMESGQLHVAIKKSARSSNTA